MIPKCDLILITMRMVEMRGVYEPLSVPFIAVECWRRDQEAFGLKGYADRHPSDNRAIMELVKLVKDGMLDRPKACHYRLTDSGRARAARLIERAGAA